MASPTIQDRDGRELSEGAQVERVVNGVRGGIVGKVLALTKLGVLVGWRTADWPRSFYKPERHSVLLRVYRCPDLLLIDQDDKGKA